MIVPQFWAEARLQERRDGKQVTVRRFGWSDLNPEEAQRNAEMRAREALERIFAGEMLARCDKRVPYNGSAGVPIREEIVARHGNIIITRNSYGALCLNTPDVLFADIDFESETPTRLYFGLLLVFEAIALALWWKHGAWRWLLLYLLGAAYLALPCAMCLHKLYLALAGGRKRIALRRIAQFVGRNPDWHLRLYLTPAGLRVLVMHQTFDPRGPEVSDFFRAVGIDPIYARMCFNQRCFRARVSPKPWRIGITSHVKPERGVWPIPAERVPERTCWIEAYERRALDFAPCHYVGSMGNQLAVDRSAEAVRQLHDELCRATDDLPLA